MSLKKIVNSLAAGVLFLSLLSMIKAHAGILFEPYGGYSMGSISFQTNGSYPQAALQNVSDSGSIDGLGYGGRLGLIVHHYFFVAGDYQALAGKEKLKDLDTDSDWKQSTIFATLGLRSPRGLRLFGSYGFTHKSTSSDDQGLTTTYTGTAYKAGLGLALMRNVSLNVEYCVYNLKNMSQNSVSYKTGDLFTKLNYSAVFISLSFPFHIMFGR